MGINEIMFITDYYSGDQIQKNKIGWACGTYGRRERCLQGSTATSGEVITRKN